MKARSYFGLRPSGLSLKCLGSIALTFVGKHSNTISSYCCETNGHTLLQLHHQGHYLLSIKVLSSGLLDV